MCIRDSMKPESAITSAYGTGRLPLSHVCYCFDSMTVYVPPTLIIVSAKHSIQQYGFDVSCLAKATKTNSNESLIQFWVVQKVYHTPEEIFTVARDVCSYSWPAQPLSSIHMNKGDVYPQLIKITQDTVSSPTPSPSSRSYSTSRTLVQFYDCRAIFHSQVLT